MVSALAVPASAPAQGFTHFTLAERFGPEILKLGWTALPNLLYDSYTELGISRSEMLFLSHLFQHWWGSANPYASQATIAQKMGLSWRQVHRYTRSLLQKGLLTIEHRFSPLYGQLANEYDLSPLLEAVLKLVAVQHPETVLARASATDVIPPLTDLSEPPLTSMADKEDPVPQDSHRDEEKDLRNSKPAPQIRIQTRTEPDQPLTSLAEAAQKLSRELGDSQHEKSNSTRLTKLFQWSELQLQAFLPIVEQARQITLSRSNVWRGTNRMPYFFSVLCNLLGVVEDKPVRLVPQSLPPREHTSPAISVPDEDQESEHLPAEATPAEARTNQLWRQVQEQLRPRFSVTDYQTWVVDAALLELEETRAVVGVPTKYALEWLQKRGVGALEEALTRVVGLPLQVHFQHIPHLGR